MSDDTRTMQPIGPTLWPYHVKMDLDDEGFYAFVRDEDDLNKVICERAVMLGLASCQPSAMPVNMFLTEDTP